ncbi:putative non-specific serine/threonine protein kinase [Helianthus annuus]|nr:putative non-specific serine/threonine protein kinase [Helianthus annuus]KAJ0460364.1 putative non-specific serine/threonine protein kinase [Helianthus annuus]
MEERRVIRTMFIFRFLVLHASITCTFAADTLSANQAMVYNETIVSPQETFELGFFRPGKSMNLYLGIWYKKIPNRTVVWVANRNIPLKHTSFELTLIVEGVLIIRDATKGDAVWLSANSSTASVRNPIGQLLDTGNFIIHEGFNQEEPIWQSFDCMTNTLLPGMKVGRNMVTGIESHLTSWKSDDDPAYGEFSEWIDTRGYPQLIITEGGKIKFRGGPWNGLRFNTSVITRLVLQSNGQVQRLLWIDNKQEWNPYFAGPNDLCEQYAGAATLTRPLFVNV